MEELNEEMMEATDIIEEVEETTENIVDTTTPLLEVVKRDDVYHCIEIATGEEHVCTIIEDGRTINFGKFGLKVCNRQYLSVKKFGEIMEAEGKVTLTYKDAEHRKLGNYTAKLPNQNLLKFLTEEELADYTAIINAATERRNADKKRPLTEAEKLMKKIEKAKAELAKLEALATEESIDQLITEALNEEDK